MKQIFHNFKLLFLACLFLGVSQQVFAQVTITSSVAVGTFTGCSAFDIDCSVVSTDNTSTYKGDEIRWRVSTINESTRTVTFQAVKCNSTAFIGSGEFNVRNNVCDAPWNGIGSNYASTTFSSGNILLTTTYTFPIGFTGSRTFKGVLESNVGGAFTHARTPDIVLTVTNAAPATCNAPSFFNITNVTTSAATLSYGAVSGVTNYSTEISVNGGSWNAAPNTTTLTQWNLINLTASTNYNVRIKANCSNGSSSSWVYQNFTTLSSNPQTCNAPSFFNITNITTSAATLNYGAVSGVTDYSIEISVNGGSWNAAPNTTPLTQWNLTTLTASTDYNLRVKANCSNGSSSTWVYQNFTTPSSTPVTGTFGAFINPAAARSDGAEWRFVGEATWRSSGSTISSNAGSRTIEFKTIAGWTTPPNQTVTVIANQLTETTGTYTQVASTSSLVCGNFTINPSTLMQDQNGSIRVNVSNNGNGSFNGTVKLILRSLDAATSTTLYEYNGVITPNQTIRAEKPNSVIQYAAGNYILAVFSIENGNSNALCYQAITIGGDYGLSAIVSAPTTLIQNQVENFTSTVTNSNGTFNGKLELLWWNEDTPELGTALDTETVSLNAGQSVFLEKGNREVRSAPGIYILAIKATNSNNTTQIVNQKTVTIYANNSTSTAVPFTVFSPVDGYFTQSATCARQPNSTQEKPWYFWQRSTCYGTGHTSNGGVGGAVVKADDTYAWDMSKNSPNFDDDRGMPVYAVADGVIMNNSDAVGWGGGSSGQLLIEHTDGSNTWYSGYLHMDNITSKKNQPTRSQRTVRAGEQIGRVGTVGASNYHLHFAVYTKNASGKFISQNATIVPRGQLNAPSLVSSTGSEGNNVTHLTPPTGINFKFDKNNVTNSARYTLRIRKYLTANPAPTGNTGAVEIDITDTGVDQITRLISASELANRTPLAGGGTMALEQGYSYRWVVKATSISNPSESRESGVLTFNIANEGIRIISPANASANWVAGTTYEIKWETNNPSVQNIQIAYWNGSNWIAITNDNTTGKAEDNVTQMGTVRNDGSLFFTVPHDLQSNNGRNIGLSATGSPPIGITINKIEPEKGVTVIVHGFSLPSTDLENSWVFTMAEAIKKRAGGGIILINDGSSGKWRLASNQGNINPNGEIILLYDWVNPSWRLGNGFAEAAGDHLFASLLQPLGLEYSTSAANSNPLGYSAFVNNWLNDKLFLLGKKKHFICHSRGNIVALHTFYRLKKYFPNVEIEHYTALDPHPAVASVSAPQTNGLMNDQDAPFVFPNTSYNYQVELPSNILYADNYYRRTVSYEPTVSGVNQINDNYNFGNFSGVPFGNHTRGNFELCENSLLGAYEQGASARQHSNVHLWYYGTINNNIGANNGEHIVPNEWYAIDFCRREITEPLIRTNRGYNKSRIGNATITVPQTNSQGNVYPNPSSLFNGNLQYSGGNINKAPAWNYHGGETSSGLSIINQTAASSYILGNFTMKHNYLYVPDTANYLTFEANSAGLSRGSLELNEGIFHFPKTYTLGATWQTINVPIDFKNRTDIFKITSKLAMVRNVRFTNRIIPTTAMRTVNLIASNLSGGNIARKQTYMDSLAWEYSSLSSDANGRSTFNFYPPLMVSDSIKLEIAGFEPLKTSLDTITLSHTNMPIPMIHTATPTTLIQYPKIKVLNNESVLTTALATLNIKANNLIGGKIYNISDSLGSVQVFSGAETTLNFTALNVGYNTLRAELRSNEDTVYQVLQIAHVPDSLDAEWTYNVFLNANAATENAMMYIDDQFVKEMTDFTDRVPVLRGSHKFTFIKRGYKTLQFMVDSSSSLAVSMVEREYQTENDSISFDSNVNYVRYWNGMSIKNREITSTYSAKRSSPDMATSQGLVRRTEWFEANKIAGSTADVLDIIVAPEQAQDVDLNTSYLLRKGDGIYTKTFPNQFTDLIGFDSATQNKLFLHGITTNYSAFGLFKAQAPKVNMVTMLEAQTGYYKTYHKHQLFWYPDSLQIGLKYLSASSPNPNFTYQVIAGGDSVRVKFNNCFIGQAQVSFVAQHDGLSSTNTVTINVVPNSNLAAQVTVQRNEVCLNEVNNVTVLTQIGKKYRLYSSISNGATIGTPRIGTGSAMVFPTGSLTTAGINTFFVTVEDIATTCLDTLSTMPTVMVNDLPVQPTGNSLYSVCQFETVPTFTTTGTFAKEWYADSLGNNILGTGNSYILPQSTSQIVGNYAVFVAQFDPITGCRSLLKKVILDVRPLPVFDLNAMIDIDNSGTYLVVNEMLQLCRPNQVVFNTNRVFPVGHSFFWTNTQSVSAQFTATNTTNLILKVTVDSTGCSFSDTLRINFYNPPTANNLNTLITQYCSGDTPAKITGSVPREGNGIYAYQWQHKNATTTNMWENMPNETNRDLLFTDSLTETTVYRRNVSSVCDVISNEITLEYIAKPIVNIFVNGQALMQNYMYPTCPSPQSAITQVGDTIRATTTSGELWWYSNNILFARGINFFVIQEGMGNTDIKVVAKNQICEDTTFTVSIRREPRIEFFFRANKETICDNEEATLTLEILSPSANQDFTFEWVKDGQTLSSGTDRTLQTNEAGEYQVIISSATCQLTTHTLTIETLPTPNVGISIFIDGTLTQVTGDTIRICQGAILEAKASSATPNTDYSWLVNNRININTTVRMTTNTIIQLRASNGTCSKQSRLVTIIFDSNVVPALSQVREISCNNDSPFEVTSSITGRFEVNSTDTSFVINANRLRINPQDLPAGNYIVSFNYIGLNACSHPNAVATFSIKEELIIPQIIERDRVLVVDSVMNNYLYEWKYSSNDSDWETVGTGSSFAYTQNGFYRVKVSLTNGETCFVYSESSSITSIETPILAVDEMDKNSVNLYPNPSEGDFTLELSNDWNVSTTKIKIVDALGRVLFTKSVENYKTFISHDLKSGIHFIQIQNEKQTLTLKLVIQK
jgi:hypothetical protein